MKNLLAKKAITGFLAATMFCTASVSGFAGVATPELLKANAEEQKVIYSTDFEDQDVSAFDKRGEDDTTVLSASTDYATSGEYALCASGRSESWNGPAFRLDDKCEPGTEYYVNAKVRGKYYSQITCSYQYSDSSGDPHYVNLTNGSSGDWLEFKNLKVSFSDDVKDVYVYFEGGTDDIYIDDFSVVEAPVIPIETDIPSLKNVYADYFKVGTATTTMELAPKSTKNLILKHCNSLTLGNELKPDAIIDKDATIESGDFDNPLVNLSSARTILNFAKANNIPVRGHVLVWHSQTPDWFFKEEFADDGEWVSKETMLKRMENYIKNVFTALKEEYPTVDFYAYDVVNEAWTDQGTPRQPGQQGSSGSEQSAWVKVFGDNSFIDYAFEYARKYAPEGTKLFYNDYNEYMTGKMDAIVEMANRLKEKGLIDGIGMQSHLDVRQGNDAFPSIQMYENALKTYTSLGLDVQITELDATVQSNSESSFEAQAKYYSDLFDLYVKYADKISAVVFWGTKDDTSWRASQYPLFFNGDYTAKPCFYSIVDGIDYVEPPVTEPVTTTTAPVTTTTTPTTTPSLEVTVKGDANCDGATDVADVVLAKCYLINGTSYSITEQGKVNADVVGEGNGLEIQDVIAIQKLVLKLIEL